MNNLDYTSFLSQNKSFFDNFIIFPSSLTGFVNTNSFSYTSNNHSIYSLVGKLLIDDLDTICPKCGKKMHINNHFMTTLKHIPFGSSFSTVSFSRSQFFCPSCHFSKMQAIPFKSDNHFITKDLYNYISDLLAAGYTNKEISSLSGVCKNIIKSIDKERLLNLYTIDGHGSNLKRPDYFSSFLAIDEFKLHNGYVYATHIIDLQSGHILWISKGKNKDVVYNFIDFVGMDWMSHVKAIACDMNSDFEEAFLDKCPHIKTVYDYFHIINNFNTKVINEVRKDELHRLTMEGKFDKIKLLKHSKYILMSSRETLKKKDFKNKSTSKVNSSLFTSLNPKSVRIDNEDRYLQIINENKLLFTADYIKEELKLAYSSNDMDDMRLKIDDIVTTCKSTDNTHFLWFAKLLEKHLDGIIFHALYNISSGKIEGLNNKIKTLRRKAYGYPDDEYFFLKVIDSSRH